MRELHIGGMQVGLYCETGGSKWTEHLMHRWKGKEARPEPWLSTRDFSRDS